MKVGDLVFNKVRYVGQIFIVVDVHRKRKGQAIKCVRVADGYTTRWCGASTWKLVV